MLHHKATLFYQIKLHLKPSPSPMATSCLKVDLQAYNQLQLQILAQHLYTINQCPAANLFSTH